MCRLMLDKFLAKPLQRAQLRILPSWFIMRLVESVNIKKCLYIFYFPLTPPGQEETVHFL